MPANPPISASENLPRCILLVEEYSALGVAISSALQKFAPLHGVAVAHSFGEAEALAETMRPGLFVLDLDPPPSGEIEFFNKLKTRYPEARALVIAAGPLRELRAERGTSGAIQFIEKPFDLAEFGAAVQALLGPWTAPSAATLRGTLRDLHTIDLVELKCLAGATILLQVEAADDRRGEIHFQKGQICHAATGTVLGRVALEEILRWSDARLSETELPLEVPRTIEADWRLLLVEAIRQLECQHRRNPSGPLPPPRPAAQKTGKKILIVDDTEMLLIFVADVLATADQNLQILTAPTGAEGLRLAASEQPDLILLDYSLTDMTGDKVCRGLLENPLTARIPVLMMSGHLTELAKTAEEYGNVVLALPKPFLSGALINAVEKLLADGSLPKTPGQKPAASPTPPLSPNGNGGKTAARPAAARAGSFAAGFSAPASAALGTKEAATRAADAHPVSRRPDHDSQFAGREQRRPTELSVTLALKIVAIQFTSSLEMETASMQPFDRIVSVKMGEKTELNGVPLETGFRLGEMTLAADGQIETLRLVPTRQPPQLPFPSSSFPVGTSRFDEAGPDPKLQLAASAEGAMRVRLTAQFELLAVELSVGFEVAAVLLRARPQPVLVRNAGASAGRPFTVEKVQLDRANELQALLVRAAT